MIKLPPLRATVTGQESPPPPDTSAYTSVRPDPLKFLHEIQVGALGMKVDRKLFERFEETVKADPLAREIYARGDIKETEAYILSNVFNKPEWFFNLERLRKSVHMDRRITMKEILAKVFGEIDRFKTKDELLEEELSKFVSIHKPDAARMPVIRQFFKAYLTDGGVRAVVDSRDYPKLADNPKVSLTDLRSLGEWRERIPEYVKDYISLNQFA